MKKVKMPLALALAAIMVPVITFAANGNGNGNANAETGSSQSSNGNSSSAGNAGSGNGSSSTAGNQVQNQVQTQNQGEESQLQIQTSEELQEKINEAKPEYSPKNEQAQSRMSTVAEAAEYLVRVAERVENTGIGDQIRTIARTQSENCDKINESIDRAQERTSFAKFFVGTNYSEVKNIQGLMEQNRLKIQELEQVMSQVSNEADATEISAQIATLQNLQVTLQNQVKELTSGFSLFGWLNRWMRGVTI